MSPRHNKRLVTVRVNLVFLWCRSKFFIEIMEDWTFVAGPIHQRVEQYGNRKAR